ncbi:proteasome assembly chaperone family protein [Halonotius terrestris]|uniref:Proteasome assembly chaperone family protein n=1 Tax=Halonotius terrestris TaxID=2487750 RepID=A0A8J8TBZ2_9EURY|nr:PAC2 family protein [Halonotius terrestris]TQQ82637.1 proteasome assembly chaperone family protein [Halonotius terrestris]
MARIARRLDDVSLDSPTLVEGFPGVGLVGKIIVDHLIENLEMEHYANVHCEGIPPVATYQPDSNELVTPVRLYVDADRGLLALQSDVPINPKAANAFADCVTGWFAEEDVLPVYVSGLPRQREDQAEEPALYGVGAGDGPDRLESVGIDTPSEMGMVSGPTGALLAHALDNDTTAVGFIVESDPQFPDPDAAKAVIEGGIEPLADMEIPTADLVEKAEEIEQARQKLLSQMQQATEESSRAEPIRMYQ